VWNDPLPPMDGETGMTTIETIAVVGAGAWGTALAINAARAGRSVILWGRDRAAISAMEARRENTGYLPGIPLDPTINITADIAKTAIADTILLVVPAQTVGEVTSTLSPGSEPLAVCAKGLQRGTDWRLSEVVREAVASILAGQLDVGQAIDALMTRPLRAEADQESR